MVCDVSGPCWRMQRGPAGDDDGLLIGGSRSLIVQKSVSGQTGYIQTGGRVCREKGGD